MPAPWDETAAGVLRLPSGRPVRGRALRDPAPDGPAPGFGVYLTGSPPAAMPWPSRWVCWRDMWLPTDREDADDAFRELWRRAETERVEVGCHGGRGRTGTALACLAVLDGLTAAEAINHVRRHYHRRAVETPWQRRFVSTYGSA